MRLLRLTLIVLAVCALALPTAAQARNAGAKTAKTRKTLTVGERAVKIARRYLGVPYSWGGQSPRGFDCSGLVLYVYGKLGVELPHYTVSQYSLGRPVPRKRLRPGDLVFFRGLGHVGLYAGNGRMIHAPHSGDVVRVTSMRGWYSRSYVGARRVVR
jgi:cell wall-associated NlpC family hydrolase